MTLRERERERESRDFQSHRYRKNDGVCGYSDFVSYGEYETKTIETISRGRRLKSDFGGYGVTIG